MGAMLCLCIDLLTEIVPATSIAYEIAEANILKRPPRDPTTNRLIKLPLLLYSYVQAGLIITGVCYFTYFQIFAFYGISADDLFLNNKSKYFPTTDNSVFVSSEGKTFTAADQRYIMSVIYSTWFLQIVCSQAVHLSFCRTITISLFHHGLFTNPLIYLGIFVAVVLACCVVYIPGVRTIFQAGDPFSLQIFYGTLISFYCFLTLSEGRKYISRNFRSSWFNRYLIEW
jgi:sodium/potassium-transporting ATPase subunit alpha